MTRLSEQAERLLRGMNLQEAQSKKRRVFNVS